MSRNVCRFWQQGYCRFGDSCKFEHPGSNRQQNSNRFGALSGGTQQQQQTAGQRDSPYNLTRDIIRRDLSDDPPSWILSCYGPGKDAPEQLFGGYPREQSFEEMRLHYLQGAMSGNPQGAINEFESLHQSARQQIQAALGNVNGAFQYIVDAGEKHPNRIDICAQNSRQGGTTGVFAVGRQQPANAFGGQPAPFGSQGGAFQSGAQQQSSAFGAPAPQSSGAFGQPSALGQRPGAFGTPAFGQPSQPSQPATAAAAPASAFGQPSQPGNAFGQPSALGAKPNPFGTPAFGQASQPANRPAFGQPSQPSSGFGQPSALGQKPNPFAPSAAAPNPFGGGGAAAAPPTNAFGQPSQPQPQQQQQQQQQQANPFGQPSQAPSSFGQPAAASNPFAKPSANPFGQPQPQPQSQPQQQPTPFGAPQNSGPAFSNAMDTTTNGVTSSASPFGAPSGPPAQNPFAPTAAQPAAQPAPTGFGSGPATAGPAGGSVPGQVQGPYAHNASRQHPPAESYITRDPNGLVLAFKGSKVSYVEPKNGGRPEPVIISFGGSGKRIWFPNGPPPYNNDTEAHDERLYDDKTLAQWHGFVQAGHFGDGIMPEVPPKREFCTWDF